MSTLYTFGCSFTQNFHENSQQYVDYKKFRGGSFPEHWTELLSKKLNFNLINDGFGGAGNQNIFTSLCKRSNQFKKDDIVIVEWTFLDRYRLADKTGKMWVHLGSNTLNANLQNNDLYIDKKCHEYLCVNRISKVYTDEIYDFEKIIDRLSKEVGFEVYYWTIISELIYNQSTGILNQKKYLLNDKIKDNLNNAFSVIIENGGQYIFEETRNQVKDGHMGELGHKVQAELFYQHIINNR